MWKICRLQAYNFTEFIKHRQKKSYANNVTGLSAFVYWALLEIISLLFVNTKK